MADIRFYHMESATLDQALPAITLKAWQSGKRVMIRVPDAQEANRLNDLLWTFRADVFLPHGVESDKNNAAKHPVLITAKDDNVNEAKILILTHGCVVEDIKDFDMVCEMLNGHVDDQIRQARTRWTSYKDAGHDLTYWQQDDQGQWHKKS